MRPLPRFTSLLLRVHGAGEIGFRRFDGRGMLRFFTGDARGFLFRGERGGAGGFTFVVRRSGFVVRPI